MEQVKSPSQIPPKPVVVLQLWTMWALCQLPPPTQRNPRRSQRKHRWNQSHCLASGRQNPRCRSSAVRLCALSRVFPTTPIHGDTCTLAKNSSCVFSQGKTHVILEVQTTSSKWEQVWNPSANLKMQSPFQGKIQGHLPVQLTRDCWALLGFFFTRLTLIPEQWDQVASLVIWLMVTVTFCARHWRHTLCSRVCHKWVFGPIIHFPPTPCLGKKIGKKCVRSGNMQKWFFFWPSLSLEVASRISNWVPVSPTPPQPGKGEVLKVQRLGRIGRALPAEYKRSQPTNLCTSINTGSS